MNKVIVPILILAILSIYHAIPDSIVIRPYIYYIGTYGFIFWKCIKDFRKTKDWNEIKYLIYFGLILIYVLSSFNKDVDEFYKAISSKYWAFGFGGLIIILLMFMRNDKKG